jgi:hypothetical protein
VTSALSFVLPDTGTLRALADRIDGHAAPLDASARRIAAAVRATPWRGPAAFVFEGQAHSTVAALREVGGRLHHAATALRRHADTVDHVVATMVGLVREGIEVALDVGADVGHAVLDVGEGIADGVEEFGGDFEKGLSTVGGWFGL